MPGDGSIQYSQADVVTIATDWNYQQSRVQALLETIKSAT